MHAVKINAILPVTLNDFYNLRRAFDFSSRLKSLIKVFFQTRLMTL